jgi:hypothetical protein
MNPSSRGISGDTARIEIECWIGFSERLMLGTTARPNQPSTVERFIEHQHQILSLENTDGKGSPVEYGCDVFYEKVVENGAHFRKRSRTISEFPNHAVHRIEGPADFFWRSKESGKKTFYSTKGFGNSQNNPSSRGPWQAGVFSNLAITCPPHRCSAWVFQRKSVVFQS